MVIIPTGAKIAGKTVQDIAKVSKFPSQCVFVAVYSQEKEEIFFPRGDQVISEGDQVFLVAPTENVKVAADFLTEKDRKKVLKAGG